ncbi:MAG: RluA family pseudouridine synthase [Lentisphaeria bacterium]
MATVTEKTRVEAAQAGRVDRVVQALTGRTRGGVRGLIQHGCVTVNDTPCISDFQPVQEGDQVTVTYEPERKYAEKPLPAAHAPFKILFEDEKLLVVEKAAHLLTVPTPKRESNTLVHLLQEYVSRGLKKRRRVEVVHRLDRGVSGVLVFAKDGATAEMLREQFAATKPEREYTAIVAGRMEADEGTFDKNLMTAVKTIHRFATTRPDQGERAVTHYQVVRRLRNTTLVRVRLETGRRNQIRVHFADAGHPVIGDPRYAPERAKHPRWHPRRMALHAACLAFTHPHSGEALRFASPLPREFEDFLATQG